MLVAKKLHRSAQTSQSPGTNDDPLGQSVDSSMAIDRRLNAIWLKGSPDRIARTKAMIALIDVPLESVILETQFLELTESGSKALGIDFTNANGQIGVVTFGSGGFVMSHVFCVVSSVSGYSQGYPTISQREAETSATVKDGESFVIGGLTQEDVINSRSKVPLLGDIPLIGQAFRTDRTTRAKTELYIVVTPHVVRRGSAVGVPAAVQIPASAMQ